MIRAGATARFGAVRPCYFCFVVTAGREAWCITQAAFLKCCARGPSSTSESVRGVEGNATWSRCLYTLFPSLFVSQSRITDADDAGALPAPCDPSSPSIATDDEAAGSRGHETGMRNRGVCLELAMAQVRLTVDMEHPTFSAISRMRMPDCRRSMTPRIISGHSARGLV